MTTMIEAIGSGLAFGLIGAILAALFVGLIILLKLRRQRKQAKKLIERGDLDLNANKKAEKEISKYSEVLEGQRGLPPPVIRERELRLKDEVSEHRVAKPTRTELEVQTRETKNTRKNKRKYRWS